MSSIEWLGLTKWPGLIVTGKRITRKQAAEILIRTDSWWLSSNTKWYEEKVRKLLNLPEDDVDRQRQFLMDIKALELNYLNNSQILSCSIQGPHGWCDWKGNIGCSSYNIGKWPTVEEVKEDWVKIAQAFPFLHLKCQLLNDETCSDAELYPVVQFNICNGKVRVKTKNLKLAEEPSWSFSVDRFSSYNAEIGIPAKDLHKYVIDLIHKF